MTYSSVSFWALVISVWFAASVAYRLWTGKGIFASRQANAVFVERWVSGRFGTGLLSRFSTARNCLQVQVTKDELLVMPHFPFTLGFMPEIYDLDRRIALTSIQKYIILRGNFAQVVEVAYSASNGKSGQVQLLLRNAERFLGHLPIPKNAA